MDNRPRGTKPVLLDDIEIGDARYWGDVFDLLRARLGEAWPYTFVMGCEQTAEAYICHTVKPETILATLKGKRNAPAAA